MRSFSRSWTMLFCFGLAACGSGGGGGIRMAALTQTNAPAAAAQAPGMAEFLVGLTDLMSDLDPTFADGSGTWGELCDGGGVVDVTVQDLAPFRAASVGDSASMNFRACAFELGGEGFTLHGGLSFAITALTRNGPDDFAVTLAVRLQGLSFTAPGVSFRADGEYVLEVATEDGETYTTVVSGPSVTVSGQVGGESIHLQALDFRAEGTVNETTGDFTYTMHGRLYDRAVGGAVDCTTVAALSGTAPDYPSSGEVVLAGAKGSKVRVLVLDAVRVRLFVDADGDGTYETTMDTTWDDL